MKTLTQELQAEKKLRSDPSRWTKHQFARDANGGWADSRAINATCWCQQGASQKLKTSNDALQLKENVVKLFDDTYNFSSGHCVQFNDSAKTNHADLMEFYDVCIAHAKNIDKALA